MAVKGAIVGDICGSAYEFTGMNRLSSKVPLFSEQSTFTDDTVMTLAVKSALENGRDIASELRAFGTRYPNAGYGGAFIQWLRDGSGPYNSCGNGSAMRVSSVADLYDDLDEVQEVAKKTAEVTHNHPEGIKGAVVTATCIWMAKHKTKNEIYAYAEKEYAEYPYSVTHDLRWMRENCFYDITCQGSVPVAIRCFLESNNYESFIRNVFSLLCDRDTVAAIGGGIAEEYYHTKGFDPVIHKYLDDFLLKTCGGNDGKTNPVRV